MYKNYDKYIASLFSKIFESQIFIVCISNTKFKLKHQSIKTI